MEMGQRFLCAFIFFILVLSPLRASAQQTAPAARPGAFSPFGGVDPERYRFDLAKNFFSSPEAERQGRATVLAKVAQLEAMGTTIGSSGASLLRALDLWDATERDYRRHDLYLFLRYATNMKLEEASRDSDELRTAVRKGRRLLRQEVRAIDDERLRRLLAETPQLGTYAAAIEDVRRFRAHTLNPREEEIVAATSELASGDFYFETVGRIDFGKVHTPTGDLDVGRNRGEIENHPDPAVREEGRKRLFAAYASRRDLFAFGLLQMIRAKNAVARLHNFKDYREEAFFGDSLTNGEVNLMMGRLAAQADLQKAYEREYGDATDGPSGQPVRFTIAESTAIIEGALAPLGPGYSGELSALLDPRNGRIDVAPGPDRLPLQGAASVYPAGTSVFYARGYEGFYVDLMLLAHEAGHAVQASLMIDSKVPMAYAAGPAYFTESFGRFNELVVADALARGAKSPEERAFYGRKLRERMLVVFGAAAEASIELEIHEAVAGGKAKTADDLDEITRRAGARYSSRFDTEPDTKGLWMLVESMYGAPLHSVADPYSGLLALKYFQMYKRDPVDFARRYVGLLRNGYTEAPDTLLKRFMGFTVSDPSLVDDALSVVRERASSRSGR